MAGCASGGLGFWSKTRETEGRPFSLPTARRRVVKFPSSSFQLRPEVGGPCRRCRYVAVAFCEGGRKRYIPYSHSGAGRTRGEGG